VTSLHFRGRLKPPGDASEGIAVELRVDDVFFELSSGPEELGRWRMDDVIAVRLRSNEFKLQLADEEMLFLADDALAFAYEGVQLIEELGGKLRKKRRGLFGRRRGAHEAAQTELPADAESEDVPVVAAAATEADLDLAEPLEEANEPVVGEPEVPGVVETVPEEPEVAVEPEIAVEPVEVVAEPEVVVEPEIAVEPVEVVAEPEVVVESEIAVEPVEVVAEPEVTAEAGKQEESSDFVEDRPDIPGVVLEETEVLSWAVEVETIDLGALFAQTSGRSKSVERIDLREFEDVEAETDIRDSDEEDDTEEELAPSNGSSHKPRRGFVSRRVEHRHDFVELKTVGGLTRKICSGCGHVSFEGEDVYQGWS